MTRRLRIAIAVPHGLSFIESALLGISDFARYVGNWSFTRLPEEIGTSLDWLKDWQGDGAFVTIYDPEAAQVARSLKFPVINLASYLEDAGVPLVCVDHEAIGRLGAAHLLGKKFRRFGFYGSSRYWYSRMRMKGFQDEVRRAGGECAILDADCGADLSGHRDQQLELNRWLSQLKSSVGIMASTDVRASMVLEACRELRLRLPEDVAVIGVDNDPVFAEFEHPPLTSVSRNGRQVGWRAAELMQAFFHQPADDLTPVLVPPGEVIERGSTNTLSIDDPLVADIARYVRHHLCEKFGVERLINEFSLSRRALEYRFRAELDTSPYDFIIHQRVEAAKTMIKKEPAVKFGFVAAACGFADERRLRLVFHRITGQTLASYRANFHQAPAARVERLVNENPEEVVISGNQRRT